MKFTCDERVSFFRQPVRIESVQPEEPMIKRIEFSLNLDDPREAAIYRALKPSLRYRRAGAVIRQALDSLLISEDVQTQLQVSTKQENQHEQA
ncbi:hypothetical protein QQ056_15380 [Oscillatoria laete-virens NRMC-F 0139]|nr:hypothetical protein [Oscillatoria laete-virens]MDL5054920.1 hypothetical protein [Oscillatoria laete-virens NRMC-F 0139]